MNHKERENWRHSIQLEKTFVCLENMIYKFETLLQSLMENKKKQGLVKNKYTTIT